MSILVFVESQQGKYKKAGIEAAWYASQLGNCTAVSLNHTGDTGELAKVGVETCINLSAEHTDSNAIAAAIAQVAEETNSSTIIISNSYAGKSIAPQVAQKLDASLATNVVSTPNANGEVTRGVFSGKAFAQIKLNGSRKVIAITPNSFDITEKTAAAQVSDTAVRVAASSLKVIETKTVSGKIPLTEAELVVSGGRGLKGPENWGLIEDLANTIGAATACSKPVSDMDWRPHSEHVGQTGITIKPNLYIAVGISGAIQHLAGVSSSKTIVVINKDPEAPFFKAADYGIVGDAFEVLPKLTEALKNS